MLESKLECLKTSPPYHHYPYPQNVFLPTIPSILPPPSPPPPSSPLHNPTQPVWKLVSYVTGEKNGPALLNKKQPATKGIFVTY